MRIFFFILLCIITATASAHGSSHPSCTNPYTQVKVKRDDNRVEYDYCVRQRGIYERAQYALCTANAECRSARERQEAISKYLMLGIIGFFAAGFSFIFASQWSTS